MTPQNLRDNLKAADSREFVITMSDGSSLRVPHTGYIMLTEQGDQAVLFANGRDLKIIDPLHITTIEFVRKETKRSK